MRQELEAAAGEEMEAGEKAEAHAGTAGGKKGAGRGYGVKLPLLSLARICPAYGCTAEELVRLGLQARRWKAERASDHHEEGQAPRSSGGWQKPPKQARAGAQVRARRR